MISDDALRGIVASRPASRIDLWRGLIERSAPRQVAEIGVFRGSFAESLLSGCDSIDRYFMVDPWRNLDSWNKPANISDEGFARIHAEAMERTARWDEKRMVLRGTTLEVIDRIDDGALDFIYVDGDHTLRGISIDLICCYRKARVGGWIGGDDFSPSIWQHSRSFEPTLVFPFAVHFAEAVNERIFALPHDQFLIEKHPDRDFEFVDLTGEYGDLGLREQLAGLPRSDSQSDRSASGTSP